MGLKGEIENRLKELKKEEKELLRYGGMGGLCFSVLTSYRIRELEWVLKEYDKQD